MACHSDLTDSTALSNDADQKKSLQRPKIASLADQAHIALRWCYYLTHSHSTRIVHLVDSQLVRFKLWTLSTDVFSPGRDSLDHCVGEAEAAIIRMRLEKLTESIENASSILEKIADPRHEGTLNIAIHRAIWAISDNIYLLCGCGRTGDGGRKVSPNPHTP